MDYYDFKTHADLGSRRGQGSNTWGWVSDDGREFVAVGQEDGTAFAEITKEGKIVYLGRLPQQSSVSRWREMKSYREYMVIGSEAVNHGVQFFDMKKLLNVDPQSPRTFSTTRDLAGFFNDLPSGRSHNVVVVCRMNIVYSSIERLTDNLTRMKNSATLWQLAPNLATAPAPLG